MTSSEELLLGVEEQLATRLRLLPDARQGYARAALHENGGAVFVRNLAEAAEVANLYAPEHLQIVAHDARSLLADITHAGEILIGQQTPFSAANYVLGVPAALPTGGYARVTSGVTAETFLKKSSIASVSPEALSRLSSAIVSLAEHEGFPAHAAAIQVRMPSLQSPGITADNGDG